MFRIYAQAIFPYDSIDFGEKLPEAPETSVRISEEAGNPDQLIEQPVSNSSPRHPHGTINLAS